SIATLLKTILDGAASRGMIALLDMHRLVPCCAEGQSWFGYSNWLPEDVWMASWMALLKRFGTHPSVFAVDLFNEPRDTSNWGQGGATDWHAAASRLITAIMSEQPQFKGLFFVQGTSGNGGPSPFANAFPVFWGEYLQGVYEKPIVSGGNRVVYSPHVFGPSVYMQSYFQDSSFPLNMENIWDLHFGWVAQRTGRAVVVGEWGGTDAGMDAQWQTAFAEYLNAHGISSFYWTLNPGSSNTGGWMLPDGAMNHDKLAHIKAAQPNPTAYTGSLFNGYCI
ncbi:unnamed protein product, partial [Phaeothamnion confervicola]